ncbi:Acyl-CoA dehydrogenase [Saccharothrix espanaensis DSM 44229]|uniref:Acyl-CoA dehydrogenase n=1 Tax=Saccharothrix espanaensis (strain ATCC 51144 / DSM 44229 / JCM 9112 / NBRC 15066 / NRRL 15764) TaxID=1179773 RepID=K0K1C4_SACES|nr:Acyl-CoA dehydrogenase [Saccharothrix espanaensis DSM 44229]
MREAVTALIPTLRENGREAEDNRWIPQDNVDLLDKAGVFRLAVPARFGGLDVPLVDQAAVVSEVSRGCASTGWVASAWVQGGWVTSLFPDAVQEEVFAGGAVRVSGGLAPTAVLVPTDGGYLLTGSWGFNTGVRGAHWDFLAAVIPGEGEEYTPVYAMVPADQLTIADDWHVSAAAGTGSFTASAQDVFVPAHRVADAAELVTGTTGGRANAGATGRNYGLITYVMAMSVAVFTGAARGAYDTFVERARGRGIAYTDWTDLSAHPLTQVKVATAANKIAAAEALTHNFITALQDRADAGEHPTVADSVRVRGESGFAVQSAKEAVEALHEVAGASSLLRKEPFQRFHRDVLGLSRHGMLTPNTNLELQGRVLLGHEPDTLFL